MNKTSYLALWAGMFALCAGLGFVPAPEGALKWLLTALALGFFLPPLLLVRQAVREKDKETLALVRNLAALSLGLTVAAIIGNFLTLGVSRAVGNGMYALLVVVSAPMVCGQYWVLSLFLWAFLLYDSMDKMKKCK